MTNRFFHYKQFNRIIFKKNDKPNRDRLDLFHATLNRKRGTLISNSIINFQQTFANLCYDQHVLALDFLDGDRSIVFRKILFYCWTFLFQISVNLEI